MKITTITGTNHFTGFKKACAYYKSFGWDGRDVENKIKKGEIALGKPTLKHSQKLTVQEGRYFIEE